ncbi:uncharacterized protein [Musca autumnalis]|uniref:uncharacterized protein n=1 Tax=Musca autumnalis TaxID=221902 RepID=UPI003CF876C4
MNMATDMKKFWIEFIELYKSLPELWRRSSDEYSNGHLKKKAYEVLVEKYKEIDVNANVFAVKRKINNMRTCYRRELARVKRSEQMALTPKDVYVPRLWYYKHLDFLKEEEEEANLTIKKETMDEIIMAAFDDDDEGVEEGISQYVQHQGSSSPTPVTKRLPVPPEQCHSRQPEVVTTDKAKALSISWEVLYRDLNSQQKLYANRMINEILYQAALGKLQESSYKLLQNAVAHPNDINNYSNERDSVIQYYLDDTSAEEDDHNNQQERKRIKRSNQV